MKMQLNTTRAWHSVVISNIAALIGFDPLFFHVEIALQDLDPRLARPLMVSFSKACAETSNVCPDLHLYIANDDG